MGRWGYRPIVRERETDTGWGETEGEKKERKKYIKKKEKDSKKSVTETQERRTEKSPMAA